VEASPQRNPAASFGRSGEAGPRAVDPQPATIERPEGPTEIADAPWPSGLDLRTRLIVSAAAATDIPVRTALASIIFGASLQWGLSPGAWRERDRLRFYAELAQTGDPEVVFPKPRDGVAVKLSRPGRLAFRARGGSVTMLAFDSPYVAANPALREDYAHHTRNGKAWAQHWRHDDGPRPTLCVIHGFGASPYVLNSAFFALPWLYSKGYDLLLYLLPFHGPRRDLLSVVNGSGLFAHGPSHFNEAMLQSVHDFRIFLDHLEASGVEQFGVTGLSLGGYVSALLAAVESRLQVAIPNAPVTSIPQLIPDYFPANAGVLLSSLLHRIPLREAEGSVALHSPLNYRPLLRKDRLMIIGGLGDRLTPPEQTKLLWEHWGHPRLHWYPGNHVLHVNRGAYLREMRRFMAGAGFAA
jgi:pimeloyl-ACP methyl ester carboxylesterase